MAHIRWTSFDLIFFDCDSTLSSIEGIDELARLKGKEWRVGVLTDKAMNGDLDLAEVYGKRLQAIRPTRGQLKAVEDRYWQTLVPDVVEVLAALRFLEKEIFIISGGLAEPVRGFGHRLSVPPENIRAVELEYNQLAGDWWRYYEPHTQHSHTYMDYQVGPLTVSSGKPTMIQALADGKPGRRLMIGDGMSDLVTQGVVDLFVGFGGVVAREKVRANAEAFIDSESIAPVLPLAAGPSGYERVKNTPHAAVFERGIQLALDGALTLKNDARRHAFAKAFGV
jgi:phosphoserine phosphatase